MPDTDTNAGPYSVTPNLIDFGRNGGFVLTGPELTLIYHSEPHANDACAILNTAHAAGRAAAQADLDVAREALRECEQAMDHDGALAIQRGNLCSIAYHLSQDEDNGGIGRTALADGLNSIARRLTRLEAAYISARAALDKLEATR